MKKTLESSNPVKGRCPNGTSRPRILNPILIILFFLGIVLDLILLFPKHIQSSTKTDRLNVLLITIDTLRADYLSCYGSKIIKTPNIDNLAKNGILFKYAVAHNVVTLPSHISILTGTYPVFHGVRDNVGFRLDEKSVILSEILKERDYKTAAFIGAFPLDNRFGLDQGFDLYDDFYGNTGAQNDFTFVERRAEEVIEPAQIWLQSNRRNSWLCWIHLFDPHIPYDPPQPFKDKYPDNFYAGEVAYTDFMIGKLLQFLKESGMERETLIILTADHGESLGEHGERTHGIFTYNCTLHIPLIFYQPEIFRKLTVIDKRVRHIDIVPTILDILNIKIPKQVQGRSLIPLIKNPRKWRVDDSYFEAMSPHLNRNWAPLQGILSEQYKYIDLPIEELYDMESDYREENNLAESKKSVVEKLDERLIKFISKYSSKESKEIKRIEEDPETLEKLRALGYIGGISQKPLKKTYTIEDDPKRLIDLDSMTHEAIAAYSRGNSHQAIEIFNTILKRRPTFSLIYSQLSFIYHEIGQFEKAIETLEKALSLGLENESILSKLGVCLQEVGKLDRSIEILEITVDKYPQHVEAYNYLGISYWRSGQFEKAIKTFEKLLFLDSNYASGYNNLGSVYLSKRQYDLAKKQFKKAIKYDPNLAGPYNGLGVVYANKGDYNQAIENWKKAVELDNKQYDALYNLGILLTKMDKFEEAIKYLEQFVATAPEYKYATDIEKMKKLIARIKQVTSSRSHIPG
ncbi:MAG: sulfatase-like hydrolase/transferase [Candidatus Aminicenantia bacterium]